MNINALKLSFLTYIKHLGLYDYLAFGWLILTFLILVILASLIARRSSVLALLTIIFSLLTLLIAPFAIKYKLNELLRQTTTEVTLVKKLSFSDSLIVEGTIQNLSKKPMSTCLILTSVFKQTENQGIKAFIASLKPIVNQSILLKQQDFQPNGSLDFQAVFESYFYNGEVNATLKAECY